MKTSFQHSLPELATLCKNPTNFSATKDMLQLQNSLQKHWFLESHGEKILLNYNISSSSACFLATLSLFNQIKAGILQQNSLCWWLLSFLVSGMKRFLAGIFTLSKYSQYFYRHQCSLNAKLDNCSNFKFNFRKKRNQKYSTTPCHHPRPAAPIFLARLFVSRFFF